MRDFDYRKLKDIKLDSGIVRLLTDIHEEKGRQESHFDGKSEDLGRLIELAKARSIDASNAIEGIRTTDIRLRTLIKYNAIPRNRSEEEIAGYRDVLKLINESFEYIPLDTNHILQLHKILLSYVKGLNYAGKFKAGPNYIQGMGAQGNIYVLFTPLSPFETPLAMERLCAAYNQAIEEREVDPLILIPVFIHDFLCIHPFTDGNGRISRLLTALLLYRNGYFIGKYISLEAKIADIKDLYYDALSKSQEGWHEGKDDPLPFVKCILSVIDMAYKDFGSRMDLIDTKSDSSEMVRLAVQKQIGKFTKNDIAELCPTISLSAVEKGLARLLKEGKIEKKGNARNSFYIKK